MSRPGLPEEVKEAIRQRWALDQTLSASKIRRALKLNNINDELRKGHGRELKSLPHVRSIQRVLEEARHNAPTLPPDPLCLPWGEGWPTDAEGVAFAFQLMRYLQYASPWRWPLTTRELSWALRLRSQFDATNREYLECLLALAIRYALLQRVAIILNRPIASEPFDGFLLFQAWKSPERERKWQLAIAFEIVPPMPADADLKEDMRIASPGAVQSLAEQYLEEYRNTHTVHGGREKTTTRLVEDAEEVEQSVIWAAFVRGIQDGSGKTHYQGHEELEKWHAWRRAIALEEEQQ